MFEIFVVVVLIVVLPVIFHLLVTSAYHKKDALFFSNEQYTVEDTFIDNIGTEQDDNRK